jgi:hypothetical protein
MKKLTAFEWYIEQHNLLVEECDNMPFDERLKRFLRLVDQAKEMEKEQIKIAWNHGFDWGMMEQSLADQGEPSTLIDANHFYNETYGGNKCHETK